MANERDTAPSQKQSETNISSSSGTNDGRRALTDDESELDDDDNNAATGATAAASAVAAVATEIQSNESQISDEQFGSARVTGSEPAHNKEESSEKEEELHRQRHKARVRARRENHNHHHNCGQPHQSQDQEQEEHRQHHHNHHRHHHHHHHHKQQQQQAKGHIKELIKPDPTVREKRARIIRMSGRSSSTPRSPPLVADSSKVVKLGAGGTTTAPAAAPSLANSRVAIAVDEEQLQRRLLESISEKKTTTTTTSKSASAAGGGSPVATAPSTASGRRRRSERKPPLPPVAHSARQQSQQSQQSQQQQQPQQPQPQQAPVAAAAPAAIRPNAASPSPKSSSSSSSSDSHSHSSSHDADDEIDGMRSPPPAAIIIPPSVAKSLSNRARQAAAADGSSQQQQQQQSAGSSKPAANQSRSSAASSSSSSAASASSSSLSSSSLAGPTSPGAITRERLAYGPLLRPGEVQVLYRSPDADSIGLDRHLKEEQAKLVAPNMRQSPIAIMSMNPTYELQNRPLVIEYPATVENLRLNNTGFSWEVKIPYQISMTTSLSGAHLSTGHRYRLDQFHCHWGADDKQGSEHTVDNNHYSAELHFVHYNMEKYRTMPKAARHPDGLVVLSVFLDARDDHHNHAELEKIVSHLRHVPLKGGHSIIKQAVHVENLLPLNRSYWSYQGSLTTPPYFESVTWFIFKHPIRCNRTQIQRFRSLKSSLRAEEGHRIETNHRKTQPLNGRTIVNYDESNTYGSRANSSRAH